MHLFIKLCFFFLLAHCSVSAELVPLVNEPKLLDVESSRIVFLTRQGDIDTALKLYQKLYHERNQHNYLLLQQMSLAILLNGASQSDPEIQLLSLFGAGIALHEQAYEIIENSLRNRNPLIQLIALQSLSRLQQDRADQVMFRVLGSTHLALRYEALKLLCKKKHEQAISQVTSLLYKIPRVYIPVIPPLLALLETPESTRLLRQLLHDSSVEVRLSSILSIAQNKRDDFLPQIQLHAAHGHYSELEAAAYTLGILCDESSQTRLERLTASQFPTVSLAASLALYKMGNKEALNLIEQRAIGGDLFAISILGDLENNSWVLVPLLNHSDKLVRLNTVLALFAQNNPQAFSYLDEILIRDDRDLAYISYKSPGKTMTAIKTTNGASFLLSEDPEIYEDDLELRLSILEELRRQSEPYFIRTAHQIFKAQQNDLIPHVTALLEEMATTEAVQCLKQYEKQLGAPLIRHYCALALYRMDESSSSIDSLKRWVKTQSQTEIIRFRPISGEMGSGTYSLTPEESSQLLIKVLEAFAIKQDKQGIALLVDAMIYGHQKNKYALAGLLLRATQ